MEALQSPQCDDFDDDANIATTTGKKQHHIIIIRADGEEREQKLQRRTGRVRVSKVRRVRKLALWLFALRTTRAFDLVGTFDLEMMCTPSRVLY